jgi:uncharacterized protein YkwD
MRERRRSAAFRTASLYRADDFMGGGRRDARTWLATLRAATLAAVSALGLSAGAAPSDAAAMPRCGRVGQAPRAATAHQLRSSALCLVNLARERHGIAPLRFSPELREAATAHSRSMVRDGSLSHYGPRGSTLTTRIARTGYLARAASFRAAENIGAGEGRGYGSPLAIVRGWMHSAGHRGNILDPGLRDFGIGIARGNPYGGSRNAVTYTLDLATRSR